MNDTLNDIEWNPAKVNRDGGNSLRPMISFWWNSRISYVKPVRSQEPKRDSIRFDDSRVGIWKT